MSDCINVRKYKHRSLGSLKYPIILQVKWDCFSVAGNLFMVLNWIKYHMISSYMGEELGFIHLTLSHEDIF